jgi:hypothetical protein
MNQMKGLNQARTVFAVFILSLWMMPVQSQPVLIEEMVEAADLLCFPVFGDSTRYKYLPSRGRLSVNDVGLPEFSFLQYAVERKSTELTNSAITEANGGGLIHFLILYDTPDDQVRKAERELQRKLKTPELILTGPVEISSGTFHLISSLLIDGKEEKELIGSGVAPVFQNSRIAFSFMVNPLKSQLLLESFKMSTPDVSITFDLVFSGLTSAFNGEIKVDWAQVQGSEYSSSSVDAIFYSSDVEETFAELIQEGAITMTSYGDDSIASDLLTTSYDHLLKMMFNPVRPDSVPSEQTTGFLEEVFGRRGLLGGLFGGSNVYKKRTVKTSGVTTVRINTRKLVDRHHFVTFNIGNLYEKYGDDKRIFRKVAIDDPTFQQREVLINLDGSIRDEFAKMVSSVSVTLRKTHQNGEQTVREVFLNKQILEEWTGSSKMIYLNKEDLDRTKWLEYDYQITWQFIKDGNYVTDWTTASSPIINLFTPYTYRQIDFLGDLNTLRETGVIAIAVDISYPFFGKTKKERMTIKPGTGETDYQMEAILPNGMDKVDYKLAWIYKEGKRVQAEGQDEFGVIIIDEIPESE